MSIVGPLREFMHPIVYIALTTLLLKNFHIYIQEKNNYVLEKLAILQSIGVIYIKGKKQGWSPTPVDIPVVI